MPLSCFAHAVISDYKFLPRHMHHCHNNVFLLSTCSIKRPLPLQHKCRPVDEYFRCYVWPRTPLKVLSRILRSRRARPPLRLWGFRRPRWLLAVDLHSREAPGHRPGEGASNSQYLLWFACFVYALDAVALYDLTLGCNPKIKPYPKF